MFEGQRIIPVDIEEEMKSAYIDYSMSVIVSRALPDVRDGLKPVHRRVLFGMSELGMFQNKAHKKSARIVGEVLGKYHPHGDSSVYDAMVRLAQVWSMRYPLVDGQGNFGSIDGDGPAAMRYTEARLRKIAEETLADIDKDVVDFQPNFDDSLQEPTVLPTKIPMLLVNGTSGIAVGMATNMAPHNLAEVIDATIAYIDNNEITAAEILNYIKGPDFPTGGIIYGEQGIKDACETGRGRIVVRAKTEIEHTASGRECIIVTEIPYMVNKAEMIKKIADLINDKKLDGISYINDESDRKGMRIVIILKKDATANVVLNHLFKMSQLQTTFSVNNIALVNGRPQLLSTKDLIKHFVEHRHQIVIRRSQFELNQAEKRVHILEGLIIACDNIDEVVAIIRSSTDTDNARQRLMDRFALTEVQARAICEMRLRQLTGLEQGKLRAEFDELMKLISHLNAVLSSIEMQMDIIKEELSEIKRLYGDVRRTEIIPNAEEFNPEDFYADDEMVITVSHLGYIKRTPLTEFRRQNRGGTGFKGGATRDEDFIEYLYVATMHDTMLFFTSNGKCFWLKVWDIPEGSRTSKGRAVQNLINLDPDDNVLTFLNVKRLDDQDYIDNNFIILCTKQGIIKKTSLEAYSRPRANGIRAISIREGDELLEARLTNGKKDIMLASKSGMAVRFPEEKVRPMGRGATGVKGITLRNEDESVVGMICVENNEEDVLIVTANGYGKRSSIDDYRITNRGGKGVKTVKITDKTGELVALKGVADNHDILIITQMGNIIRSSVASLRVMGRATQGVRLINLREGDTIASVAYVEVNEESVSEEISSEEGSTEDIITDSNEL